MNTRTRTVSDLRSSSARVLQHAELDQIYLRSCEFWSGDGAHEPPFTTRTDLEVSGHQTQGRIEALANYVTEGLKQVDEDDDVPIWRAEVLYVASYRIPDDAQQYSDEDLEAFALAVGAPALHPYARELIQSLSGRSAYPAYTLGLLTPILDLDDDEVLHFPAWASTEADSGRD